MMTPLNDVDKVSHIPFEGLHCMSNLLHPTAEAQPAPFATEYQLLFTRLVTKPSEPELEYNLAAQTDVVTVVFEHSGF